MAGWCCIFFIIGMFLGVGLTSGAMPLCKKMQVDAMNMLSRAQYAWDRAKELHEQASKERQATLEIWKKINATMFGHPPEPQRERDVKETSH